MFFRPIRQSGLVLGLVVSFSSLACSPPGSADLGSETSSDQDAAAFVPEPGRFCYSLASETLTGVVRLTLDENQGVAGDSRFTIHNAEASYYSAYAQKLEGLVYQDQLAVDITTWIEYDVQNTQETWILSPDTLTTDSGQLTGIDCALVAPDFAGPDGLDAAQLLAGIDLDSAMPLEFALGETSVEQSGTFPAEDRGLLYQFYGEGGETLDIEITGPNDQAQFDVIAPSGLILARSESTASLLLPHSGEYQIILRHPGGAAPYRLRLTKPNP